MTTESYDTLYAKDHEELTKLRELKLEQQGQNVDTVSNAREIVEKLEREDDDTMCSFWL